MEIGETLKLKIEGYDMKGYGVAHHEKKVIFVDGAINGETVIARITAPHKKYAFATLERVLEPSMDREAPACPYYGVCGGCDLMHISYSGEKEVKANKVSQALRGIKDYKMNPIIAANNTSGYRNKVMIPFMYDKEEFDVLYGFYSKGSHDICSMDKCLISDDLTNNIVYFINRYLNIFHISIYDEATHTGLFKEVMVRRTALNEYMVVLVTTRDYDFSQLVKYLNEEFEEIKSIYLNINSEKTNVVLSYEYKLLYGKEVITEDILGLKFNVSPSSFMQVNHDQCERLYSEAFRMANLTKDMNVIDAYCGMGSITLNIAKEVKHVYGIEIVEAAIKNANSNKVLNNIDNATFICGKCEEEIKKLVNLKNIDVIFFDPPRKGCDIEFLNTVIEMNIPSIVYISCNIATAARDVKILEENGYKLIEVTPVDLFPRTAHVETVLKLDKIK